MANKEPKFDSKEVDERNLILSAREGNVVAFEQLVQRYDRKVFSIASLYVQSAEDAKDIYQEVFVRVFKGIQKFQFRSEFSTWLYRITTNVCLSHRTRNRRHTHVSIEERHDEDESHGSALSESIADDRSTDQSAMDSEITEHVERALDSLSPKQRMVFTLRHYEGHKLREIAEMMNCTEGTVKKYLFTATERMRVELKKLME
ncbi:MAG TPA: sigma-70 family RNA polymerase sigma factor [Bacteroidota bacterium]|nr:sigma-70 family RNA polymerase sigma factor [Bacteroidota bacterium]